MNTQNTQGRENLKELTKTFNPIDIKFLPSMRKNYTLEECYRDAAILIGGLKKFIDNNHSLEGLDEETKLTFGEIIVFKK